MMPPTSGIQAIAAATFEGKPVDVDFGPGSGSALGGGGGGIGSGSGMIYIHKMANVLYCFNLSVTSYQLSRLLSIG